MSFTTRPTLRVRVSRGIPGVAATIAVSSTSTLAEGSSATVTNAGTSAAASLVFGIPRGAMPAVGFNFDTSTTDADPGSGDVRFNHATPASVTAIYFDNEDRDGNTVTSWLDSFDDSTNTAKGHLVITPAATPSAKLIYNVTGTVVDGTGYRKVTVSHVAGTTLPSSAAHLGFQFAPAGNKGADGAGNVNAGSSFANDNRLLRSDGTGTDVQASAITVDDSGNMSGVGTVASGAVTSTGEVKGDTLAFNDSDDSHKLALTTGSNLTANRTLTVNPGDADRTVTISGNPTLNDWFDQSVKAADSPQFAGVNVGHASDTTISRSAAGVIAVEGVDLYPNIPQNSQSAAYTAVLGDANKHILHPAADNNARTFTIPANASVAYPIGTTLTFINEINTVTISITSDTLTLSSSGSTGSRTLAANGIATAIKITSTKWMISGTGLT
jgi:hypothetical protein